MVNKQYFAFGNTVFGIVSEAVLPHDRQLESFEVSADTEADHIIRVLPADEKILAEMAPHEFSIARRTGRETALYLKDIHTLADYPFSLLMAEAKAYDFLLERDAFVLHASMVAREGKALLFTAPSGTGKSTQAHFWRDERGCAVINEDRVILFKKDNTFYATGCWAMGSAGYTHSEILPVDTVVLLSQGAENALRPLTPSVFLGRTIPQCAFTASDTASRGRLIALLCDLVSSARTVSYACINHPSSVDDLEKALWSK
jgi:hypothetical protein